MSRDTTGQPVTSPGPGKSPASAAGSVPPVPGPDSTSDDAGTMTAKAASVNAPTAKTPTAKAPTAKAPTAQAPTAEAPTAKSAGTQTPASGTAAAQTASPGTGARTSAGGGPATVKPATVPPVSAPKASEAADSASGRSAAGDQPASPARETKVPRMASEKVSAPSLTQKTTTGPRRVRLAVSRLDPWSVMKLSFLLSIAIGIMIVVASVVFWMVLDGLHVFTEVNDMIVAILGEETKVNILQFVELKRVVSLSTMIAIVDVVLLTALSTIAAFLYNVVAALVGGVHLTLTDE